MKPLKGKWYYVRNIPVPEGEGPALCMMHDAFNSSHLNLQVWRFTLPDIPDRLREHYNVQNLVKERDILRECTEPMTATRAMSIVKNLKEDKDVDER